MNTQSKEFKYIKAVIIESLATITFTTFLILFAQMSFQPFSLTAKLICAATTCFFTLLSLYCLYHLRNDLLSLKMIIAQEKAQTADLAPLFNSTPHITISS